MHACCLCKAGIWNGAPTRNMRVASFNIVCTSSAASLSSWPGRVSSCKRTSSLQMRPSCSRKREPFCRKDCVCAIQAVSSQSSFRPYSFWVRFWHGASSLLVLLPAALSIIVWAVVQAHSFRTPEHPSLIVVAFFDCCRFSSNPNIAAGIAGSLVTRYAAMEAFAKHKRSTTTTEIIAELGARWVAFCPEGYHALRCQMDLVTGAAVVPFLEPFTKALLACSCATFNNPMNNLFVLCHTTMCNHDASVVLKSVLLFCAAVLKHCFPSVPQHKENERSRL